MEPQSTQINPEYLHKDIDDVDTSNMTEEEIDDYIEKTYGYIDDDLSNKNY